MDETHDTSWRDSLLLTPGTIAGVRVRPLSAWHMHAMTMLGVKVAVDAEGYGPTAGDILMAIPILRSQWTKAREGLPVPSRWLRSRLRARWAFQRWQDDANALLRFVARYTRHPMIDPPKDKGTKFEPFGCPPHFAMALDVAQKVPSLTFEETINMPLCQLHQFRAASDELARACKCSWSGEDKAMREATRAALNDPALLAAVEKLNAERKAVV